MPPSSGAVAAAPRASAAASGRRVLERGRPRAHGREQGDLWQVPIDGSAAAAVWSTRSRSRTSRLSPDGTRVAFVRATPASECRCDAARLARRHARSTDMRARAPANRRDRRHQLVARWRASRSSPPAPARSVTSRRRRYSGSKIIYTITENVPGADACRCRRRAARRIDAAGRRVRRAPLARRAPLPRRSHVRRLQAANDLARRHRRRRAAGCCTRTSRTKFWSITGDAGANAQPSPDGKWIAFVQRSRRLGSPLRDAGGRRRRPIQITKGKFEAWRPQWSPDSTRHRVRRERAGTTTAIGTSTWRRSTAIPSHATITTITSGRGTNIAPIWSPDGTRLVYQHTDPRNSADLFVVDATTGATAAFELSDSMPAVDRSVAFVEPEMVHYAGPDGQQVPAWLFVPKNLDRIEETSGHRLDSWRRREPELRRLARPAELRRLLQLPPVPAAEGLRRDRAGLSRQHRLRPRAGAKAFTWTSAARTRRTRGW